MASRLRTFYELMKETGKEFSDDHATKLSASLAYYTVFSIGPLLLVLISILDLVYKKSEATTTVFDQVGQFTGPATAMQLESIFRSMSHQNNRTLFGVIGILVFIYGATSIFTEIQSSINYIWSVKSKPKRGWLKYITDRLLSFLLIIGLGLLMMVSLFLNVAVDMVTNRLQGQMQRIHYFQHFLGDANIILLKGANGTVLFVVVTLLFAVMFKVLPDARIHWKDALVGAAFTGVLFIIGKMLITYYLSSSKSINAYGAAASFIIILSWIYYSAIILYFGAEFTDVYARKCGKGVTVKKTAVFIIKHEMQELPRLKTHTDQEIG